MKAGRETEQFNKSLSVVDWFVSVHHTQYAQYCVWGAAKQYIPTLRMQLVIHTIYKRHKLTLINCWGKHAETTKFSANIFTCKVSQRLQEFGTYLIPHWNSIHWNEKHLNKFWNSFCMFWSWPDDSTIADILIMKSLYFTWLGIIMTYDVSHYRAFYWTCNAGATMLPNMYRVLYSGISIANIFTAQYFQHCKIKFSFVL